MPSPITTGSNTSKLRIAISGREELASSSVGLSFYFMRTLYTLSGCLLAFILSACATSQSANTTETTRYKVIAYAMGRTDFSRINAQKLTHINYAFGLV